MENNPILQAARDYLSCGWSIIPVSRESKRPIIAWKEYQQRYAKEAEINQWFGSGPLNIGIVTGPISNLCVVDVDPRHHGDDSAHELGLSDPDVVTGSGGAHYYYSGLLASQANICAGLPGIDFRGQGGYVVAPPSIHPETGREYKWLRRLPEQLRDSSEIPSGFFKDRQKNQSYERESFESKWIYKVRDLRGVSEGSRNNEAAKLIGKLITEAVPSDRIWEIVQLWNSENKPPLSIAELRRTVESVEETHRRNHGTDLPKS